MLRRASVATVLEMFFDFPVLAPKAISERANISIGATRAALDALETMGIVREITGKRNGRVYACEPLLATIFEEA